MSGLTDLITSQLSPDVLNSVTAKVGGSHDNTQRLITAALPVLIGALQRNTQSNAGAESLASALDRDHSGAILGQLGNLLSSRENQADGIRILEHVLGARQNHVARQLGQATGMDSRGTAQLLSMLAPVVLGALGKAKRDQNLNAGGLHDLLNRERRSIQQRQPKAGLLESLLDSDGDGDVDLSDVVSQGSGLLSSLFKK